MGIKRALHLNSIWHSRLPELKNWHSCFAYGAEFSNVIYACAIWGPPIARAFNNTDTIELRRMAISDDAPKYTATRMIGWMLRLLRSSGKYKKAISYQDTSVHQGTIYKASGWKKERITKVEEIRWGKGGRVRNKIIASGEKIRWGFDFK